MYELQEKIDDLLCILPLLISSIKNLKDQHNLYSQVFIFNQKDYLLHLRTQIIDLRKLLSVFDIEIPSEFTDPSNQWLSIINDLLIQIYNLTSKSFADSYKYKS